MDHGAELSRCNDPVAVSLDCLFSDCTGNVLHRALPRLLPRPELRAQVPAPSKGRWAGSGWRIPLEDCRPPPLPSCRAPSPAARLEQQCLTFLNEKRSALGNSLSSDAAWPGPGWRHLQASSSLTVMASLLQRALFPAASLRSGTYAGKPCRAMEEPQGRAPPPWAASRGHWRSRAHPDGGQPRSEQTQGAGLKLSLGPGAQNHLHDCVGQSQASWGALSERRGAVWCGGVVCEARTTGQNQVRSLCAWSPTSLPSRTEPAAKTEPPEALGGLVHRPSVSPAVPAGF